MYILQSNDQDEGVEVMVQQRGSTKTVVTLQKIKHEPRVSEAVWAVAIIAAQAGEIWGKPAVCLQIESSYILEMYDGLLT